MIEIKIATQPDQVQVLTEVQHVSELKRVGVPLKGTMLFQGVESGSLTFYDAEDERTYTWLSEPIKRSKNPLSTRFRIRRFTTLGDTWFEVQQWKWYWPIWDTWTHCPTYQAEPVSIKYKSLYIAREAVCFYQRATSPRNTVVDHL